MGKRRAVGRNYGMKYNSKGHKDRNRHSNGIKRSGQARLVYVFDMNHNIPTTWRWARGDCLKIVFFFAKKKKRKKVMFFFAKKNRVFFSIKSCIKRFQIIDKTTEDKMKQQPTSSKVWGRQNQPHEQIKQRFLGTPASFLARLCSVGAPERYLI